MAQNQSNDSDPERQGTSSPASTVMEPGRMDLLDIAHDDPRATAAGRLMTLMEMVDAAADVVLQENSPRSRAFLEKLAASAQIRPLAPEDSPSPKPPIGQILVEKVSRLRTILTGVVDAGLGKLDEHL